MFMENRLREYEATYRLRHSFRHRVVKYIERCHLEDGGYFFARVPPSGGLDTYFAVKSLSILGVKPNRPEAIASFLRNHIAEGTLGGITGIFLAVEVLNDLGYMTDELKDYARTRISSFQNKEGGFGVYKDVIVGVYSELQATCRAVSVLKTIGASFDEEKVKRFIFGFLNLDGGYGAERYSTMASTYYATEVHKLLGVEPARLSATRDYLRQVEETWEVQFIEDAYWLVLSLANLGEKTTVPDRVTRFVMLCQRANGGFSRAPVMGIPTLEHTFYALSILREIGVL
jgi:hypothetical protein